MRWVATAGAIATRVRTRSMIPPPTAGARWRRFRRHAIIWPSPRSAGAFMPLAAASTEIMHAISTLTKIRKNTPGRREPPISPRAAGPRERAGSSARPLLGGRRRTDARHLPPGRGLRPKKRSLDEPHPHADAAPRPGRRGPRRAHVRHFWRPDARRLLLGGERGFHTVAPLGDFCLTRTWSGEVGEREHSGTSDAFLR